MEQEFLTRSEPPPRVSDAMIAMRLPSLVVFLASACYFGTPILYYGVSHDVSSLNCWFVGGILLMSSALRLWLPLATVGLSWLNMVLGLWAFVSPWVFNYTSETGRLVSTLALSVIIVAMSIVSIKVRSLPGTPLATAYEDRQGLEEQDYDYIGPDRY